MVITSIKINHQRATAMDFSTPYLETGITIMVSIRKGAISATAFLGKLFYTVATSLKANGTRKEQSGLFQLWLAYIY